MSREALNLQRICKAIDHHDATCEYSGKAVAVEMHPVEVERLGWSDIRGVPIWQDPKRGTGTFRIVCDAEPETTSGEQVRERELVEA